MGWLESDGTGCVAAGPDGSGGCCARPVRRGAARAGALLALCVFVVGSLATSAGASASLPDGRAYEKVTPADKSDTDIVTAGIGASSLASHNGDKLLFGTQASFAGATVGFGNAYVATRTSSGWDTVPVTPPDDKGDFTASVEAMSSDLSTVAVWFVPGGPFNFKVGPISIGVGQPHGPFTTVANFPDAFTTGVLGFPRGGDQDLSNVMIGINNAGSFDSSAAGTVAGEVLYEWASGGLRIVGVRTDGSLTSGCGSVLGNGSAFSSFGSQNAVSRDGSRIFFLSPDPTAAAVCGETPRLYVRENGATTTEVSAPEPGVVDPNGPQPVVYAGAAANGSKVFFVTTQELTADDSTHDPELYEYDLNARQLTRISKGPSGTADADVRFVLVSDDGSTVYFVARGELIPGQGTAGQPNLYRYDTTSRSYTYITTLVDADVVNANLGSATYLGPDARANWYTTPDGSHLLFQSSANIGGANPPGALDQLYRYDAQSGDLTCVSCPPSGGAPEGDAEFTHSDFPDNPGRFRRPMSDDGSYVFFTTSQQLADADADSNRDVYEWHGGDVSLISSGTDTHDALFIDATPDARDVFFATHARLVASDRDTLTDYYDARVGGGFLEPPRRAAPCSGDACQGALSESPFLPLPTTATIHGGGNVSASSPQFSVSPITAAQRAAFARGRKLVLRVKASAPGRLSAVATAPLGPRNHRIKVASASTTVREPGTTHVALVMSSAARRTLARRQRTRMRVEVRFSISSQVRVSSFVLRAPRAHRRHRSSGK